MKQILVILFLTVFTLPSWGNDLKPVQNCKDIIFNNPELKVEVSDWELEFVSFFNRTDIKDIEFKNIYFK